MVFLKKSFKVLIASLEANWGLIKKHLKEKEIINKNYLDSPLYKKHGCACKISFNITL